VAHENAILVGGASDESGPIEGFSVLELSALGAPTGHDAEALGSFTQPQGMSFVYHSASKKVYATGVEDDAEGIPTAFVASRSDSGQWTRFVNPMGRQGASGFWLQPSGAVFVGGLDSVGEYGSAMLLQELPSGDLVATDELSLDSFPVFGAFGATQNYLDEDDKKRRVLTFPGLIPGLFGSEPSNLYWEVELDSGIDAWKKREARVVVDSEEIDAALVFTSVAMRSEAQYVFTYGSVVDPQTMTQIFGIFRLDRETQTWSKLSLDEAGLPGPIDGARLEYDGDQNKFFLSGGIQIDLSSGSMVPQDAIWSWTPGDVSMVLEHQPELSPFRIPLGIHSSVMVAGERLLVLLTNKDASYGVESFNVDTSEKIEVQSAGAPVLAYIRPVSVVFGSQILGLFPGTTGSFAARYLMVARGTVFDYESNVTYDDGAPFNGAVSLVDHDAATAFVLGGFDLITSRSPRRALNVEMTCE